MSDDRLKIDAHTIRKAVAAADWGEQVPAEDLLERGRTVLRQWKLRREIYEALTQLKAIDESEAP